MLTSAGGSRTWGAVVAALALLAVASNASGLVITGGPTYALPGGGSCAVTPGTVTTAGTGAVFTCTGVVLGAHSNVYLGIRNDSAPNGNTMTGADPTSSSAAVFRISSTTATSITYTSTTTVTSLSGLPTPQTVTSRLVITGPGTTSVVATGGTPGGTAGSDGEGDVVNVFRLVSGSSFTFDVDILASDASFGLGQACPAVYDPSHAGAGAGGDRSRVDLAFYYSDCGDGIIDSPEACDGGVVLQHRNAERRRLHVQGDRHRVPRLGRGLRRAGSMHRRGLDLSGRRQGRQRDGLPRLGRHLRRAGGLQRRRRRLPGQHLRGHRDALSRLGGDLRRAGSLHRLGRGVSGRHLRGHRDALSGLGGDLRRAGSLHRIGRGVSGRRLRRHRDALPGLGGVCDVTRSLHRLERRLSGRRLRGDRDALSRLGGVCDLAEVCDGSTDACPADAKQATGPPAAPRRASATWPEVCDGTDAACPADAKVASGTTCRGSAGVCDVAEVCDGSAPVCPADAKVASGTTCRALGWRLRRGGGLRRERSDLPGRRQGGERHDLPRRGRLLRPGRGMRRDLRRLSGGCGAAEWVRLQRRLGRPVRSGRDL